MTALRNPLLWITTLVLLACAAFAQDGSTPTTVDASNPWSALLALLSGQFGWLPAVLAWMGALRVPMRLVSGWLQDKLTAFAQRIAESPELDDDEMLERITGKLWYRLLAYTIDVVFSLKLPTRASLLVHFARTSPPATPLREILPVQAIVLSLLLGAAIFTTGCNTLHPDGVYRGDQVLHKSELTITTSYDLIRTYVTWEKANREQLTAWPQIKRSADYMRANAKQWFATANVLHDAYAGDPTAENRDQLLTAVAVLQTALNEAAGYMALAAAKPAEAAP